MLQGEHSAILLTFIKVPFVFKIFVSSIFEWPFYTGFTVAKVCQCVYLMRSVVQAGFIQARLCKIQGLFKDF